MYMDMPPEIPPPAIGHNSRAADIQRIADEIREAKAAYLKMAFQGEICERLRVLHVASVSSLSDAAFRSLWLYLMHGNRNGDGITIGHKRLGMLLERSDRSVRRSAKELEDEGWLTTQKHQRDVATRSGGVPQKAINAIIFEILERTDLTAQRIEVPALKSPQQVERTDLPDRPKVAGQTPIQTGQNLPVKQSLAGQNASFRPAKNDNITIIDNHRVVILEREREAEQLDDGDFSEYNEMFNSWGLAPALREHNRQAGFDKSRRITDPVLFGAVQAQIKLGHPPKIAVAAAQMTTSSMLARIAMSEDQRGSRGGVHAYFQKEFIGNIGLLLDDERKRAEQAQAPPQATEVASRHARQPHWREERKADGQDTSSVVRKLAQQNRGQQS